MPDEYGREIRRILRSTAKPIAQDPADIAADLRQLKSEADAGGHRALARLIGRAIDEATQLSGDDIQPAPAPVFRLT